VENKIRPFALGRKNWLFSDTTNGADASAAFYTLVQNALLYELDPTQYLKLIFDQLPGMKTVEEIETLLPWNVAKN
jgi:transposase